MSNPDFALAESISTTNTSYFILVYVLILVYCCIGLAVVCDVYFVPALQKLSYTYDLPPDIAGSTLMALGASVPELFASLIGVFVTEDDIGTGSIIGSSCFNLIAVPAACAFVAVASFPKTLTINPMPVIRNSAFYAITILVLLLIIKDNKVDIPEAIILLLFFVMYMAFMIFCAQSKRSTDSQQSSFTTSYISTDSAIHSDCHNTSDSGGRVTSRQQQQHQHQQQPQHHHHQQPHDHHHNQQQQQVDQSPVYGQFYLDMNDRSTIRGDIRNYDAIVDEKTPLVKSANQKSMQLSISSSQHLQPSSVPNRVLDRKVDLDSVSLDLGIAIKNSTCLIKNGDKGNHNFGSCVDYDQFGLNEAHEENWVSSKWILVPMLPLTFSMKVLAPCKFKNTSWTIWTFIVSIALIGGLTYVSVWMVHLFGQSLGIPETVAGMTILSWGTGIPELIASIVLIKKTAQADMAICNTIGSNVIDVSFCLSVPWIVKCILNRTEGVRPEVAIQSAALPWTSFTLLLSVMMLLLIFKLNDWALNFTVGVWLTVTYIAFVIVATYLESSFSQDGLDLFAYI